MWLKFAIMPAKVLVPAGACALPTMVAITAVPSAFAAGTILFTALAMARIVSA